MKKTSHQPLLSGHTYHIYNQGNNKETVFFEEIRKVNPLRINFPELHHIRP